MEIKNIELDKKKVLLKLLELISKEKGVAKKKNLCESFAFMVSHDKYSEVLSEVSVWIEGKNDQEVFVNSLLDRF